MILLLLFGAMSCNQPTPEPTPEEAAPPVTNLSVIQGAYDAFDKGDIPSVLATMAPDIEWNEAENFPYADGNPYIGPDAILNGVFARIGGEWEGFTLVDRAYYEVGTDMVLTTGRYQGKFKATGKDVNAQFAHLWWLKDGKTTRFQQYTDTKQAVDVTTK